MEQKNWEICKNIWRRGNERKVVKIGQKLSEVVRKNNRGCPPKKNYFHKL